MNPLIPVAIQAVKHSLMRTISVVCTLLVIIGIGWAIYAGIVRPVLKPNPSTTQKAEQIYNTYLYSNKRVASFGISLWGWDFGLLKYDYPKEPIIKQTEIIKPLNTTITIDKVKKTIKKWYFLWLF